MLNYEANPAVLAPLVPRGCELDLWHDRAFVSIVGFRFLATLLRGVVVPFHRDFLEVNLRFYVRRAAPDGVRRGVVFVKEIVPRRMIAYVARALYNENYVRLAMRHTAADVGIDHRRLEYGWRQKGRWQGLSATATGAPSIPGVDTEARFITEHFWGYARQRDGGTTEYRVEHPPWRVRNAVDVAFDCDVETLYGSRMLPCFVAGPSSAFVAEGSSVVVYRGERLS